LAFFIASILLSGEALSLELELASAIKARNRGNPGRGGGDRAEISLGWYLRLLNPVVSSPFAVGRFDDEKRSLNT
jgi:hypothetical protein